jgi:uncharacterized protein (TIGR03083 family)
MTTALAAPSIDSLCEALLTTSSTLAAVMRRVTDPGPIAVGEWSIGETAAHVSASAEYFLAAARGERAPHALGEGDAASARFLSENPERDPGLLAARLEAGERALVEFARHAAGDPLTQPFEGVEVPLSSMLAVELGELLVHGYDIATAAGLRWRIDPDAARLALQGYLALFPSTLDATRARGVRLTLEIRIGGMRPVGVSVADGRLTVRDPRGLVVDAHLAATPAAYLLLMWNRIPPWKPLLRGQLMVWGRRPWRAGELSALMAI